MIKRLGYSSLAFTFAIAILFISALRTAAVRYEFTGPVYTLESSEVLGKNIDYVDYHFPYPGNVLPDSSLWPLKAGRDKMWLVFNTNPGKEVDLLLLFADKRLLAAQDLFEREQYELGYITLTKAEKYLEKAYIKEKDNRERGLDTTETLQRLNKATLAHYGVIEEMQVKAPDDARPKIIETQNYSKMIYGETRNALLEKDLEPIQNPFNW